MTNRTTIFWLLIFTVALLAFVSCSDDDDDNPTGTTPVIPAELVGSYEQDSVTVNGAIQNIADFFDYSTGTDRAVITAYAGGQEAYRELDASDSALYNDSGYFVISGSDMSVIITHEHDTALASPDTAFIGTWDLTGSLLTLTTVESSDTVVIMCTKQ